MHVSIKYFKCYQSILPLAYKWKCNAPLHYRHNDNGHSRWGELWSNVSPLTVVLKILSYILEACFSFFLRWWNYCTFQQERDNFSTFPHPWRFPVVILLLPLPQRKETQLQHWIQSKAKENCKNPTLTQKAMKRLKETPGRIKKEGWFSRKNAGFEPSHVPVIGGNTYQHRSAVHWVKARPLTLVFPRHFFTASINAALSLNSTVKARLIGNQSISWKLELKLKQKKVLYSKFTVDYFGNLNQAYFPRHPTNTQRTNVSFPTCVWACIWVAYRLMIRATFAAENLWGWTAEKQRGPVPGLINSQVSDGHKDLITDTWSSISGCVRGISATV